MPVHRLRVREVCTAERQAGAGESVAPTDVVPEAAVKPSPHLNTGDARSSGFLRALFQFSERTAGKTAKLDCGGVELFGVVGAAGLECGEPAAKARELIWRQLDDSFGDFFDFHVRNIHVSDEPRIQSFIRCESARTNRKRFRAESAAF